MKVSVIGTGYVGLVSGVCLADKGNQVVCVDVDQEKVDKINKGVPPIYEKGLEELLRRQGNLNFKASTNLNQAVMESDISLIAVGTPFDGDEIDLKYIKTVSRQLGEVIKKKGKYHVVVVKSTVVPGTTDEVVLPILEEFSGKKAGADFGVGMNPEFLREGEAIEDFMFPDRIVMGGVDEKTINVMDDMYRLFVNTDKVRTNNRTAEMIKYTANSLLATMISFSNEIGNLCALIGGIDIVEVMKGVHLDKRLSPIRADGERIVPAFTTYLEAGCGFGGSCFPKDVKALIAHGEKNNNPMDLLNAVMKINEKQPHEILHILKKHFSSLEGVRIAVLGLAFKPGTDDIRESPSITVIRELLDEKAEVVAFDPIAKENAGNYFKNQNILFGDSLEQTIKAAEAILLLTRWEEFNKIPDMLVRFNPQPLFIDGRRMLDKKDIKRYEGIGLNIHHL